MADEAFKMVQHCATLGLSRIAVVGEDDAMGRAGLEAVNKAIAELKLPPLVASAFMPRNSTQVDAAVATIQAAKPQAIKASARDAFSNALARLDMPGAIKSLNVSNAAAIAMYAARHHLKA